MPKKKKSVVANLQYAGQYRKKLADAQKTGTCPFCRETFQKENIIRRSGNWLLRMNQFPTKDKEGITPQFHFLILPQKHIKDIASLRPKDYKSVATLLRWLRKHYGITGGGLLTRFGDPLPSGATILHVHFHIVIPRIARKTAIPVYMPIG